MNRREVEILIQQLPGTGQAQPYFEPWAASGGNRLAELNSVDIGIKAAAQIARSGSVPKALKGPEYHHIRSAITLLTSGKRGAAPAAEQAREIMENDTTADLAQALLLVGDSTIESVASLLGVTTEALAIYEALYFNVKDRSDELAYLRQVVASSRNPQLLETGLNGTADDVLWKAGWRGRARGGSSGELVQRLQLDALACASAWTAGDPNLPVPPLAARGLASVQKQALPKPAELPPFGQNGLSDIIAAEMANAGWTMKQKMVEKAEAYKAAKPDPTPEAPAK